MTRCGPNYGNYIESVATQLGIPIDNQPTEFNTIIERVYVPNDEGELTFDMFILGVEPREPGAADVPRVVLLQPEPDRCQ